MPPVFRDFLIACGIVTVVATVIASLPGCSKPEVKFDTLEDARATARANALFNAAAYRAESPRLDGYQIVSHGDPHQEPDCPQGSGWAPVSYMKVEGPKQIDKITAQCSTVSASVGCYLDADFAKKPFAHDAMSCQPKVPFPIPRIAK